MGKELEGRGDLLFSRVVQITGMGMLGTVLGLNRDGSDITGLETVDPVVEARLDFTQGTALVLLVIGARPENFRSSGRTRPEFHVQHSGAGLFRP